MLNYYIISFYIYIKLSNLLELRTLITIYNASMNAHIVIQNIDQTINRNTLTHEQTYRIFVVY